MTTHDTLMALADEAAEKRHVYGAPVYNTVAAKARAALSAAIAEVLAERDRHDDAATLYATQVAHWIGEHDAMREERDALIELLRQSRTSMQHARIFISTKEKMHPTGVQIWDEELAAIDSAMKGTPT